MGIDKVGKKWWVQNHLIQNKVDGWTWPGQPQSKVRIFLLYKEKKGKNRRVSVANSNLPPFGTCWVGVPPNKWLSFDFFYIFFIVTWVESLVNPLSHSIYGTPTTTSPLLGIHRFASRRPPPLIIKCHHPLYVMERELINKYFSSSDF